MRSNRRTNVNDSLDLHLERTLDAPRDLVWKAWTDPEHIKRWWAPRPYETPDRDRATARRHLLHAHDRAGRFRLQRNACVLEVVPGNRIVWSSTMKGGYRPNEFAETAATDIRSPRSTPLMTRAMERPATRRRCCTRTPRIAMLTTQWASKAAGRLAPSKWQKSRGASALTLERDAPDFRMEARRICS